MIHVCFGLYDATERYSKFTGTTICSIFENTKSEVTAHILHDDTLTADNREKFSYIAGQYGQRVKFYNIDELFANEIERFVNLLPSLKTAYSSIATMYRFLIPQLLPPDADKCIYLDSDIIVELDINELWQIELEDNILAVVPECFNGMDSSKIQLCKEGVVQVNDYFNAGVLLINLNRFRNEELKIWNGIEFIGKNPQYKLLDQDVLNYCFSKQVLKLPVKFNYFIKSHRYLKENVLPKRIYHYTYSIAGIGLTLDMNDSFNRLWMYYFIKTPWFGFETFNRLAKKFGQIHMDLLSVMKESLAVLSVIMSGKTRAFFITSADLPSIRKKFFIRDDEEIILADKEESLPNLVYSMAKAQGRKIFFIVVPNFEALSDLLKQLDFIPERDFINGKLFLMTAVESKFNSFLLVKEM